MATEFSGVFASELRDTQGEILDVSGADISELEAGRGIVNDNHSNKLPDVIGRITYAKKILKIEDCEDEDQKSMWQKIKAPMIYGRGLLFDDEDHRSAKAAAAIIRHQHTFDSPLRLKCSVEGGILQRGSNDDRILKRTKIKGLALTLSPANNATVINGLNLQKSSITSEEKALIKSCIPLAKNNVPTFIEIADSISELKIRSNIGKINKLTKALSAGYGGAGAPSNLTGGGVIQAESLEASEKPDSSHIECSDCGKSQYYMKHQTKCRNCGKSFKFDTLAKYFLSKRN
jgi:hypothetical protein